jgi:phosphomannomutase
MNMFSGFDIRGRYGEGMTKEYVWNVGKALADWLPEEGPVIVAHSEKANPEVLSAVVEGLRLQGRAVIDGGVGDKAAMVHLSGTTQAAGGVVVSHDELEDLETLELFQETATPITSDNGLSEIAALIEAGNFVPAAIKGEFFHGR